MHSKYMQWMYTIYNTHTCTHNINNFRKSFGNLIGNSNGWYISFESILVFSKGGTCILYYVFGWRVLFKVNIDFWNTNTLQIMQVVTTVVVVIIAGGGGSGHGVVGVTTKLHECKWMHYIRLYVPVIMTKAQMPFNSFRNN